MILAKLQSQTTTMRRFLPLLFLILASCASSTHITSEPVGAKVYVDGIQVGVTPYRYSDSKISGAITVIELQKEGFEKLRVHLKRNERIQPGPAVGGFVALVPWIWIMGYDAKHHYILEPSEKPVIQAKVPLSPAASELIALKKLLDTGALTEDDFFYLKELIISEKYNYDHTIPAQITDLKTLRDSNVITEDDFYTMKEKVLLEARI